MASSVRSLPNHYEVLGLSPTASEDEINKAFAKAMGLFGARPVSAAAQLGLAFETLRDPLKREAYDRSLGLIREAEPEPEPLPQPRSWMMAGTVHSDIHFNGLESRPTSERRPAFDNVPPPVVEPELPPPAEPSTEQRLSALVASLQALAKADTPESSPAAHPQPHVPPQPKPAAALRPQRQEPPQPKPAAPVRPQPQEQVGAEATPAAMPGLDLEQLLAASAADRTSARYLERWAQWKRPVIAVGGFILAAGTIGALAGVSVKDAEQQQAGVTTPLPPAKTHPNVAASAPIAITEAAGTETGRPIPLEAVASRTRHMAPAQRIAPPAARQVAQDEPTQTAPPQDQPDFAATDPLAPQPAAAQVVAASLPLPNSVVARTIDRIGYACGSVASTAAVDGAPGTFKITCSSGQTYQAAPVRGRYHFRRLSK